MTRSLLPSRLEMTFHSAFYFILILNGAEALPAFLNPVNGGTIQDEITDERTSSLVSLSMHSEAWHV